MHWPTLPVHSPPTTLESITACRRDDLGVANGYVKVTDYAVRGLPASRDGRLRTVQITA
jgi:hypothetical protein